MYEVLAEKYKGGKISFQGLPGSYSQIACATVFPDGSPACPSSSTRRRVATPAVLAMLPIDNSVA